MAFFEEAKRGLNLAGQSAVQKTKDLSEIAKLNSNTTECENKIRNLYSMIGFEVYKAYKEGAEADISAMLEEISNFSDQIEKNKNRINEINAANICPNCGAKVSKKHAVCGNCGYRLQKIEKMQHRFCSNCGSELMDDAIFCGECGTRVTN